MAGSLTVGDNRIVRPRQGKSDRKVEAQQLRPILTVFSCLFAYTEVKSMVMLAGLFLRCCVASEPPCQSSGIRSIRVDTTHGVDEQRG